VAGDGEQDQDQQDDDERFHFSLNPFLQSLMAGLTLSIPGLHVPRGIHFLFPVSARIKTAALTSRAGA
jgi:hypothetical protein